VAYCPECGHHNREAARFCGRCGASLLEPDGGEVTQAFSAFVEEEGDAAAGDETPEGAMLVIRIGGGRAGEQFALTADRMAISGGPRTPTSSWTTSRSPASMPCSTGATMGCTCPTRAA
jgi:hypothetical protein